MHPYFALDRNVHPRAIFISWVPCAGGGNLIFLSIPSVCISLISYCRLTSISAAAFNKQNGRSRSEISWIDKHEWNVVAAWAASYPWWLWRHWLKMKLGQAAWLTAVSLRRDAATRPRDSKQRVSLHGLSLHALVPIGYAPVTLRIGLSRMALNKKHVRFHYTRLTTRQWSGAALFKSCSCAWYIGANTQKQKSALDNITHVSPQVDQLM